LRCGSSVPAWRIKVVARHLEEGKITAIDVLVLGEDVPALLGHGSQRFRPRQAIEKDSMFSGVQTSRDLSQTALESGNISATA
jgi:hypothetical protein